MQTEWKYLGPLDTIPRQGGRRLCFGHDGRPIAIFRTSEDSVFALIDECPHRKGPLSEGIVSGTTVACPLHNWIIRLDDGEAVAPDMGRALTLPVRIMSRNVYVGLPPCSQAKDEAA